MKGGKQLPHLVTSVVPSDDSSWGQREQLLPLLSIVPSLAGDPDSGGSEGSDPDSDGSEETVQGEAPGFFIAGLPDGPACRFLAGRPGGPPEGPAHRFLAGRCGLDFSWWRYYYECVVSLCSLRLTVEPV
ncbi:uncharacterized protein LOC144087015 [Stigmatopora argus]